LFKRWSEGEDQPATSDYETITGEKATDIEKFAADFALVM